MAKQLSYSLAATRKTLNPLSSNHFPHFSTLTTNESPQTLPPPLNATTSNTSHKRQPSQQPLDETICYMMSRRPWTTRLQNSIRSLVPHFDQQLVLSILQKSSERPQTALNFFRWVDKTGFEHDNSTFGEIIPLLARNLMINHARCLVFDEMPKRNLGLDEAVFVPLLEAYGKAKIPQEVVKMFNKMGELGVKRSVVSYNAFFKAILSNGRYMMAKRYFNKMVHDGVKLEISTYNILIWGFGVSLKTETATRFFNEMKENGISPDVITYNNLLNGWARAKKMDDAQKVFDEMCANGFSPNSVTYNIMIKGFSSVGKVDDALKLFDEMREKGLEMNQKTFAGLMPGICDDLKRANKGLEIITEMAEKQLNPKDKSVFIRLVSTLCKSGDLDNAIEAHEKITTQFKYVRVDPMQYLVLMEYLCKGKKYDNAVKVLDEMLENNILMNNNHPLEETKGYNLIIDYLCKNGRTNKAETFFRQLMKKGILDELSFNNLIKGHAKENSPESASEILNIMTRRGIKTQLNSYSLLIESYLKKGEFSDAKQVFDNMIEQGHEPSSNHYKTLMESLLKDNRVQTASRVMKVMVEKGIKENSNLVHEIIEKLFLRGHVEEALGRVNLLLTNDRIPDVNKLLTTLCEVGKAVEACKLAEFCFERKMEVSFECVDKVLDELSVMGETLMAYDLLCKVKELGGVVDKNGCDELVKKLIEEGNTKQADTLSRVLAGGNLKP